MSKFSTLQAVLAGGWLDRLSPAQQRAYAWLYEHADPETAVVALPVTRLAELTGTSHQNCCALRRRLAQAGLIRRVEALRHRNPQRFALVVPKSSPRPRRRRRIGLTTATA